MGLYTLVVGTQNWSSWSLRPYMALMAADVPFELVVIKLRHSEHPTTREQILRHSPAGKVPVLKIAEPASSSEAAGQDKTKTLTVWDSLAICETIAERHPQAGLWPKDANRRAIARSLSCEMHAGFPDLRDQLTMEFARRLPLPELRDATRAQIARIIEAWEKAFAKHGGPFLFGDFTIADCMYAPVVSRFVTYGVEVPQASCAYMERMMATPGMVAWGEASQKEVETGLRSYQD